jgi:hypothetical protein
MKTILITGILFISMLLGTPCGWTVMRVIPQEAEAHQIKSEARKLFMRGKLLSNQKIVEGLSLKDFDLIDEGAAGVVALVKGQHWFVLDTDEYKRYSRELSTAAERLQDAAKQKNIEAAALRYFDLTLTCIDCHQYLETRKY